MTSCIPFADLLPGHVIRVTDDQPRLIWAVDLVRAVTGKNRNHATEALRALVNDGLFATEKLVVKSQPGSGNSKTRLVTFQDAIELIMVLPGNKACAIRVKCAEIITRYLAGDTSLVHEMEANNQSVDLVNELARDSLGIGKRKIESGGMDTLEAVKLYLKAANNNKITPAERDHLKANLMPYLPVPPPASAPVVTAVPVGVTHDRQLVLECLRNLIALPDLPSEISGKDLFQNFDTMAKERGIKTHMNNNTFGKHIKAVLGQDSVHRVAKGVYYVLDRDHIVNCLSQLSLT